MRIRFQVAPVSPGPRLIARVVNQDAIPADLEPVLAQGAKTTRFAGKAGQIFEGFVDRQGQVVRVALAGIGSADANDRTAALERAGGGLVARFLTSGETTLAIDLSGSGLSAADTATLLLGARLRGWRYDI